MKKSFKIALITALLPAFTAGSCYAAVLNNLFIKSEIEKSVTQSLKNSIKGEITVKAIQLPYSSLNVPEGKVGFDVDFNQAYFSPRTVVKVNVTVNGEVVRSFGVPVEIKVEDYVWVVSDTIYRGKAFNSSNVSLEKMDISSIAVDAARKSYVCEGKLAGKFFKPGEIVDKKFVGQVPDVIKNNIVSVIFKTENLNLVLEGEAMEDGKIGDLIRVKNNEYKKYYMGKVISSNQVLVEI